MKLTKLKLKHRVKLKKKRIIKLSNIFKKAVKNYKRMHEKKMKKHRKEITAIFKKEEKNKIDGIEIKVDTSGKMKKEELKISKLNVVYPLIPRHPKKNEKVFAYVNIKWSAAESALVYIVIEPKLSEQEKKFLTLIKNAIIEKVDVDFTNLKRGEAKEYLKRRFEETVKSMAVVLPEDKQKDIMYYIERDFIGLGKIEPLMMDPNIEDISCDGVGIPIYIYHRNPQIGTIRTNIVFDTKEELDLFANKIAQRCGKTISVAKPLVDASLPDGSRIQITLGTDIAKRGSNFTIRKFTEEPLTPIHIIKYGTIDSKVLAYLWMLTEFNNSMLISGGTASGKTSLLNALSLFIKPEMKIVTIEDTSELRLPHPHWVPQVARQAMVEVMGRKLGEVDMFDLLKESLRQRPDFIIVGEVRGKEAYVMFQQLATGHAGFTTIHADSIEALIDRLTTPPIELPPNLIENLDVIIFIVRVKRGNKYVRRVSNVFEIVGFDRGKNIPITNEVFRWNPSQDTFETVNPSVKLKEIMKTAGLTELSIQRDIGDRIKILDWMTKKNITHYKKFAAVMKLYYTNYKKLIEFINR